MSKPQKIEFRIITDCAASGKPDPGGWGAIVVDSNDNVMEHGGRVPDTTNNRMEMTAVIRALESLGEKPGEALVRTDSKYLIDGMTGWVFGWMRRGWTTQNGHDVKNRDLWESLVRLTRNRKVHWEHVRGHEGIPANERADRIAVACSKGEDPQLYAGPLSDYGIDVDRTTAPAGAAPPRKKSRSSKGPAHSYLSLVSGVPRRHATWAECKQRVEGASGARYRKTASEADEREILRSWGVNPEDLE